MLQPPNCSATSSAKATIASQTSRRAHPMIDGFARMGVQLVGQYLARAVRDGHDTQAREGMMLASYYGGICLGPVNTAAGHAIAYPLGTRLGLPHGLANAIVFPHVLAFNQPVVSEKTAEVAEALGFSANSPDALLENACRLSIQWLSDKARSGAAALREQDPLYQSTFRTFAHSPRPMLKSILWELEDVAPELFATVRSTVFRSWDKPTIVSDFVLRWALAHGVASVRPYRHRYVSTGEADQNAQLQALVAEFGALDFFCINDTTDDAHTSDPRLQNVLTVLQGMLPAPSGFESPVALPSLSATTPAALSALSACMPHSSCTHSIHPTNASGLKQRA